MGNKLKVIISIALLIMTTACGRNMGSNVYKSDAPAGKVLEGVVISARPIVIKDTDKVGQNQTGALLGAGAGGLAGNQFGSGGGNLATTVAGAVVGGIAGAFVEDALSTQDGMEYIVRLDSKQLAPNKTLKKSKKLTDGSIASDINSSVDVAETQTQMISVIMDNSTLFQAGQRVLVIFSDDRPRLAPRY